VVDSRVSTHRAPAPHRTSPLRRAYRSILRNRALVVLLAAATVIRVLIMVAYQPALWYGGDSGSYIQVASETLRPKATFAIGYSAFLKVLKPTGTLFTAVAVQHLLGLLMAVAGYALLRHRGVRRWVACLAVVPVLFDSLELDLEQAILVETFATSLMVAAIVLLLWQKPGTVACLLAGGLLIGAWFVRPQFLPVIAVVVVYLAVRRIGWRPWAAFVLAAGIPYAGVQLVIGGHASPYTATYISYYARVAGFADCSRITLTDEERGICPTPQVSGHVPDWYIWVGQSPGFAYRMNESNSPVLKQFAIDVVRQQPLDYLRTVGTETALQFVDGLPMRVEYRCADDLYRFARTLQPGGPGPICRPQLGSADFQWPGRPAQDAPAATPLSRFLEGYASMVRTPRLVVLGVYVLVAAAAVVEVRRRRRRGVEDAEGRALAGDAVTLAVICLTIIVLPMALFMYASRYALPALPLLCLAAGMAAEFLVRTRSGHGVWLTDHPIP
jgi:hypothetical protein